MFYYQRKTQAGFSLIEMIVALAVFSLIITTAVGALLMLVATNQQLQAKQSVMTNLSFALDSMTREIRMGSSYYCDSSNNDNNNIFDDGEDLDSDGTPSAWGLEPDDVKDCDKEGNGFFAKNYHGIAFLEGGESITGTGGRILYYFDKEEGSTNKGKIMRRVGDQPAQSIVSSGIYIVNAEFIVSGSNTADDVQPTVTIFIEAKDSADSTSESHTIQTTVTQRTLDI